MRTIAFVLCIVALLLSGCQQYATLHDFGQLRKGMSVQQVRDLMQVEPTLTSNARIRPKGNDSLLRTYDVLGYPVPTTTKTSSSGAYGAGTTYTITDRVLVLFVNGKARYWGYPSDFFRSDEEDIVLAVHTVIASL